MVAQEFDLAYCRGLMDSAIEACKGDFSGLRTGRASASLVDHLPVNVYGSRLPLNQVATVSVPDSRTLSVQVWDRSQVDAVTRAILNADLGLNPRVEGASIHLPLPTLSQERRQELVKVAHKIRRAGSRRRPSCASRSYGKAQKDGEKPRDEPG